jgi:hypothetical protein
MAAIQVRNIKTKASLILSLVLALTGPSFAQSVLSADLSSANPGTSAAVDFDVVSIKLNRSGDSRMAHSFPANGDSVTFTNVPLMMLIFYANNSDRPGKVIGLPEWTRTER